MDYNSNSAKKSEKLSSARGKSINASVKSESTKRDVSVKAQNEEDSSELTFTVDDAIELFGFGKFQVLVSIFAGISWMAEAMEMLILSILSPALKCDWGINEFQQALITSCVFGGMSISSTIWGKICDRYGRRMGIMLISITTFFFGMLSAFAPNYTFFIILRTLTGIAIGGVPQSITYYSEFLPARHRAKCVILMQGFWALGGALEAVIAIFVMESLNWRWLLGISTMPLLISAATCYCVPESARYLMTSGKPDKAYHTLEVVARLNNCEMPPGKLVEVTSSGSQEMNEKRGSLFDLFNRELLRTTLLLLTIWFVSTFCYYGIILYTTILYTSGDTCHGGEITTDIDSMAAITLFNETALINETLLHNCIGAMTHDDYIGIVITSVSEFPGLILSAFLLESIGRRKTMALDLALYSAFILLLLICLPRTWVTIFLFVTRAFASGAFQSCYVYTPEVYPTTMRAVGLGVTSGMGRLGALISPFVAHVFSSKHYFGLLSPIFIYGALTMLSAICALLLPIETRGRQMQDYLGQSLTYAESMDSDEGRGEGKRRKNAMSS